jgi:hypothetical protein
MRSRTYFSAIQAVTLVFPRGIFIAYNQKINVLLGTLPYLNYYQLKLGYHRPILQYFYFLFKLLKEIGSQVNAPILKEEYLKVWFFTQKPYNKKEEKHR